MSTTDPKEAVALAIKQVKKKGNNKA